MFGQLISMATKAISGGSGSQSGYGGQRSSGRSQMMQKVGSEAIEQVRKAGPDAAQRQLSKTKFGTDPRARKAAKAADDLARRFAGSDPDHRPGGPTGGSGSDRRDGSGPFQR